MNGIWVVLKWGGIGVMRPAFWESLFSGSNEALEVLMDRVKFGAHLSLHNIVFALHVVDLVLHSVHLALESVHLALHLDVLWWFRVISFLLAFAWVVLTLSKSESVHSLILLANSVKEVLDCRDLLEALVHLLFYLIGHLLNFFVIAGKFLLDVIHQISQSSLPLIIDHLFSIFINWHLCDHVQEAVLVILGVNLTEETFRIHPCLDQLRGEVVILKSLLDHIILVWNDWDDKVQE